MLYEDNGNARWKGFAIRGEWRPNERLKQLESELDLRHYGSPADRLIASYHWEWRRLARKTKKLCPHFDAWLLEDTTIEESGAWSEKYRDQVFRNPVILVGVHEACGNTARDFIKVAEQLGFYEPEPGRAKMGGILDYALDTILRPYTEPQLFAFEEAKRRGGLRTTSWTSAGAFPYRRARSSNR